MTEAASSTLELKTSEYIQIWADSFSQVLAQITGASVPCSVRPEAPADLPPGGEDDLWLVVTSAGALRGEMRFRLSASTGLRLAQILTSEPAAPESPAAPLTPDHREAVVELLRQVSGIVSTSAQTRWGELRLRVEGAAAPSWPSAETFWLEAGVEGAPGLLLELGLSAALVAELRAGKITDQDWLGVVCSYLSRNPGANSRETAEVWGSGFPAGIPAPTDPAQPLDVALAEAETSSNDFSGPQRAKIWIQRRIRPWSS